MASLTNTNKLCSRLHSHYHRLHTNSALGNPSKIGKFQLRILLNDGGRKVIEILSQNKGGKKILKVKKEERNSRNKTAWQNSMVIQATNLHFSPYLFIGM